MFKDYTQLYDMKVTGALKPENLRNPQKRGALRAINLIKKYVEN